MNKEKQQIEEMAHLVCEMALKPNSCRECKGRKGGCFTIPKMERLYNAGYRKQSEGEWVHGENGMAHCSECGNEEPSHSISPYCPECGAKMKGGE